MDEFDSYVKALENCTRKGEKENWLLDIEEALVDDIIDRSRYDRLRELFLHREEHREAIT